jgi:chemotaxis protein methyltransferase CheR
MALAIEDSQEWPLLKEKIRQLRIFDTDQYNNSFLVRRLHSRLVALKMSSYKKYIHLIETSPNERKLLAQELTIHVTNFFRDRSMWSLFTELVLPELIRQKREISSKKIDILSAGSSTGEEPISIAICLHEALGNSAKNWNIKILGVDIDAESIEKAHQGIYDEISFKETPQFLIAKYFDKIDERNYTPKKFIKDNITYRKYDVFNLSSGSFDVIFCRNTVIYFDLKAKSTLYENFYKMLNNNGFLIIGKTEILHGRARDMFQVFDDVERIYVKDIN